MDFSIDWDIKSEQNAVWISSTTDFLTLHILNTVK